MPGADGGIGRGGGQPQGFSPAVPAVLEAPNGSIGGGISHGSPSQGYNAGLYPEQHLSGPDSGLFTVQAVAAAQLRAARQDEGQHVQAAGTQSQAAGLLVNGASLEDAVHEQGVQVNGAPNGELLVLIPMCCPPIRHGHPTACTQLTHFDDIMCTLSIPKHHQAYPTRTIWRIHG